MKAIMLASVTLHPQAECTDCEWSRGPGRETTMEAKTHVKDSGHEVVVDKITRTAYGVE